MKCTTCEDRPGFRAGQGPALRRRARLAGPVMILVLALAASGGCGPGDPMGRQAVSGLIRLDEHPLDQGAILLEPLAGDGPQTPAGATIRDGAFAIERARGPVPGPYRVRIYSSSGTQAPPGPGQSDRTRRSMVEGLPDIYNARSELRMDVVAGGSNRLELDLRGDGGN